MKLLADSGSTKTAWIVLNEKGANAVEYLTDGLNPFFQTEQSVQQTIENQLIPQIEAKSISEIFFYGAGCAFPEKNAIIEEGLRAVFVRATIHVASDLLGAARGLCGMQDGIACIMGTGSNSCMYQDGQITHNVSPLGFILGDEGSGAVLGKILLGDYLKNQLPSNLSDAFATQFELSRATILDRVYKQAFPNRFLASFSPFLSAHKHEPYVQALLHRSFTDFFVRNVQQYDYRNYAVHFTGSIAYYFQDILQQVAQEQGVAVGVIEQTPMPGLVRFHRV
jgi:N-acetylglucosamine kinase-like BadF-type ATPase